MVPLAVSFSILMDTLCRVLCLRPTLFPSSPNGSFPTWKQNIQSFQFCFLSRVPMYSIGRNAREKADLPQKEHWACAELFSGEFLCWTDTVTHQMHHTCHRGNLHSDIWVKLARRVVGWVLPGWHLVWDLCLVRCFIWRKALGLSFSPLSLWPWIS